MLRRARTKGEISSPRVPGREIAAPDFTIIDLALPDTAPTSATPGEYGESIAQLEQQVAEQPEDYAALYLLAQAYTNQGRREIAASTCRTASELNPLAAGPYEVLAALAEDQGEYEEAKRLLKKAIYLSPDSAAAYLELGAIYAREGERARARTMWAAAHELLLRLPADATVTPWEGPPAGEWLRHVEVQLAAGD
jgi:tetratricopeptide (TPR) repeat protein